MAVVKVVNILLHCVSCYNRSATKYQMMLSCAQTAPVFPSLPVTVLPTGRTERTFEVGKCIFNMIASLEYPYPYKQLTVTEDGIETTTCTEFNRAALSVENAWMATIHWSIPLI